MNKTNRKIKLFDILLPVIALIVAAVLLIVAGNRKNGTTAEIIIDGKTDRVIDLTSNGDEVLNYGTFTIEIKDGKIGFTESDCYGHDCINTGFICRAGETAVCLPNRAVIKITGDKGGFPDAISY